MSITGAIGGAISGALVGGQVGGWYGAVVGAVIGGVVGGFAAEALTPDIPTPGTPKQQKLQFTSNTVGSPIPDMLGTCKVIGTFIAFGREKAIPQYQEQQGGKGGDEPDPAVTGYKYYATWAQGICLGPVDALLAVYMDNDKLLWSGNLECPVSGGEETITLRKNVGSMTFYFGTDDQVAQSKMTRIISKNNYNSPFRGLCWAFFDNCCLGDFNRVPTLKFIIQKRPTISFSTYKSIGAFDYNPAHAMWYIMETMTGLPNTWLDSTDFESIADTLYSDGLGISILLDQQQPALNYIESISTHIDSIMRYGFDSKFHPKLIRDDYTVGNLETIDESVTLDTPSFKRGSWVETINEAKAQYTKISGSIESEAWTQVASELNSQTTIYDLVEYNGKLYGGTYDGGRLFEWNGTDAWTQVAPQLNSQAYIRCLAVYNDKIYGGGGYPAGTLFEWNGTDAWTQVAPEKNAEANIYDLVVYDGSLYGSTGSDGSLFRWNGTDAWVQVAPQLNSQDYIYCLAVYNDKIYGGTGSAGGTGGRLFEWNGTDAWVQVAPQLNSQRSIESLAVYKGKLYGGTYNDGLLFEWNGTDAWTQVAPQLNSQHTIHSLVVYNNKLYGSTAGNGLLFEWNDADAWIQVAPQLNSQGRVRGLTVFNDTLYGGTYNDGYLFEWSSGKRVKIKESISNPYAFDVGNRDIQDRLVSETINVPLITNNENAVWAARHYLRKKSYPFAVVSATVNRDMFRLEVGDCFKFSNDQYGITDQVFRVGQVQEEGPESEKITITASEDIYAVSNTITEYEEPEDPETDPTDYTVDPFTYETVIEAPYAFSQNIAVVPAASRESDNDLGFGLYMSVDDGASYSLLKNIGNLLPYGTLIDSYSDDTYTIDADGFTIDFLTDDVDLIETTTWAKTLSGQENIALLGDEFISFQTITPVSGTEYKIENVIRGRFGTVKDDHAEDETFWVIRSNIEYLINSEIVAGVTRKFKLVPYNIEETGDVSDSSVNNLEITGLSETPYMPVNFNANGSSYAARYDTDIVLTWSPRYRGKGAGIGIPGQVLADTDREGYFEVEVYVSDSLVRTTSSIDAATWTYTNAMNTSDNGSAASAVTFKILNYRTSNGYTYESDQAEVTCYKNN